MFISRGMRTLSCCLILIGSWCAMAGDAAAQQPVPQPGQALSWAASAQDIPPGEIAFTHGQALMIMDLPTRQVRTVAEHEKMLSRPFAWSPDGKTLVFPRETARRVERYNWNLFQVSADGGEAKMLTSISASGGARCPAFSADGARVAYMRDRPEGLYVMGADGSDTQQLTDHGHRDEFPAWSPDGKQIAFVGRVGEEQRHTLCVYRFDEDAVRELHPGGEQAVWSADGERIFFIARGRQDRGDVFSIRPDGSELTNLTNSPESERWPKLSPDGTRLAYQARGQVTGTDPETGAELAHEELRLLQLDAGKSVIVCQLQQPGWFGPSWSPDGQWIVYAQAGGNEPGLSVVPANENGEPVYLGYSGAEIPLWRPVVVEQKE